MIYYVTRDIERAMGIDLDQYPGILLVSNKSPLADLYKKKFPDRIWLPTESQYFRDSPSPKLWRTGRENTMNGILNTLGLLKLFEQKIKSYGKQAQIFVFKNTPQIERYCAQAGWQLINASAELVNKFERKISQWQWFEKNFTVSNFSAEKNSTVRLPAAVVGELVSFDFNKLSHEFGRTFILQFNTGHTGEGTVLINSESSFSSLQKKFPKRQVRISKYIRGQVYTVNACVFESCEKNIATQHFRGRDNAVTKLVSRARKILVGEVSLQLTGLSELTDNPWATVGNDWGAASQNLTNNQTDQVKEVAKEIGMAMASDGWQGLFGIDVVFEEDTNKLYLIEVNARQPASASLETQLAHLRGATGPLDWQVRALADLSSGRPETSYNLWASQAILRKRSGPIYEKLKNIKKVGVYDRQLGLLEEKSYFDLAENSDNIFLVPNSEKSGELIRIQTSNASDKILKI